jgi:hypothetical protein
VGRDALREYVRGSLWVLPGLSVLAALAVGAVLSSVRVGPRSPLAFQGTPDDARTLLFGITGTMITVIALLLGLAVVDPGRRRRPSGQRAGDRRRAALPGRHLPAPHPPRRDRLPDMAARTGADPQQSAKRCPAGQSPGAGTCQRRPVPQPDGVSARHFPGQPAAPVSGRK